MPEIFMSYRRADAAATAGRLFDRLAEHFGPDEVFRDIDTLDAGDDFERTITNAIASARFLLFVGIVRPHSTGLAAIVTVGLLP